MAESATTSRQFSLRHLKHETKVNHSLYAMLLDQNLVDVILSSDGTNIRAHRLILSANSSYFKTLFESLESNRCQIPIVILKDVPLLDLKAIVEFMYRGEVCVEERHLTSVLKSAELLKVNGLTEVCLALASQLNGQSVAAGDDRSSPSTSAPTAHKRPRISDGPKQTPQMSSDLFAKLSNARFEIRPTPSTSSSSNSPSNRAVPKTSAQRSQGLPVVKNIVIPSNQIHNKKDSLDNHAMSSTSFANTSKSSQKSPNIAAISSQQKSTPMSKSPINETNNSRRALTSTWTPSQSSMSRTMVSSDRSSGSANNSFVEVLLDDETQEYSDDEIDIKPPIFELNQRLAEQMANSDAGDDTSSPRGCEPEIKIISKLKPSTATPITTKGGPTQASVKSRSSSTSSQSSLPPPPSYRVVQRSSSRLLRNIIKPTACMSSMSSSPKGKSSEDKNKAMARPERQSLRQLVRNKTPKTEVMDTATDNGPEISCPECGQAFTDEKKWNEHIASAHMPAQT
ncbi:unnamed protein product [Oppiella nova]|uniref:BTB domain-containing protein n=1 Tax=Oppiella nova TaxID=334625 RepID=A0A7R9LLV3_9ACAR|nr:unnamed protein product [Oppiella nova]CAG2164834.1 unnamed protein product [Oppiella nova]